jgi:hypothetical protein
MPTPQPPGQSQLPRLAVNQHHRGGLIQAEPGIGCEDAEVEIVHHGQVTASFV